jgi:hypothetical protein
MKISNFSLITFYLVALALVFCGYWVYFFVIFKRKYNFDFKVWLAEDKKRYRLIKTQIKLFIQEKNKLLWIQTYLKNKYENKRTWWTTRLYPGIRRNLRATWTKETNRGLFLEIVIIIIWAIFVSRAYLDMDPLTWPSGGEFPSTIQTHYIWTNLPKCGACIFWNGFSRGGAPAFADMHGSMLHPLVIILTLLMGPLNGAKLVLVTSFMMAGVAQWWLSKVMGFNRIPRVWSGLLAVVGAHLAGRMELGVAGVVLSTAACSLVLAPGVALGLTGKRQYTILLGGTIGMALLAGQGYMQVGLILGILPAFLIFLPCRIEQFKNLWKEYLLAGFLAVLIAGVFLIPMIHFYPNVIKYEDSIFSSAQPLGYIPLNHLIDDVGFYYNNSLKPLSYPYLYTNFIGWIPILLAILGWRLIPKSRLRFLLFFIIAICLVYLISSAILLKFLVKYIPLIAGIRHPPQIAGLAIPLILGLSAWGLDLLLKRKWHRLALISIENNKIILGVNIAILLLTIPLIWSIKKAYDFGQTWITTIRINDSLYKEVSRLKTTDSEWVNLPFGVHSWMIPALDSNLKISDGIRTWWWRDRENPPFKQELSDIEVDPRDPNLIRVDGGISYLSYSGNDYAYIQSRDKRVACKAHAIGGNIDIECPPSDGGQLIVHENNWIGWSAWVDQTRTHLQNSNWLSTDAPAGRHNFTFRYRPWDAWAGIFLSVVGILLSIVLWMQAKPNNQLSM